MFNIIKSNPSIKFFFFQVIVQVYNELQSCVSDIDRVLLQHKLNQVEKVSPMSSC